MILYVIIVNPKFIGLLDSNLIHKQECEPQKWSKTIDHPEFDCQKVPSLC